MEFSSQPVRTEAATISPGGHTPVALSSLGRPWQWLTFVSSDDPVRYIINRGFAAVLVVTTVTILALIPFSLITGELLLVAVSFLWTGIALAVGWLNRRGTIYGALLFAIMVTILTPLALPPANYVGSEADSSLSLLLLLPIIITTLFVRPAAGIGALIFQAAVTSIAVHTSSARDDLATDFVLNLSFNLLIVTIPLIMASSLFVRALRDSIRANEALQQENQERRRIEAALRTSEQKWRELAEGSFEGIAIHAQGQFLEVNRALCQMLEYTREELMARSVLSLVPEELHPLIQARLHTGSTEPYELLLIRKDGSLLTVEVSAKEVDYLGQSARLIAVQEVTQRKLAESNRLALALEQQKTGLLRDFLNTVSHDLKTPLAVIYTSLYLYERASDPEQKQRKLDQIKTQAKQIEQYIQDILAVSRLDGVPETTFQRVDLTHLLERIQEQFQSMAEKRQIGLRLELNGELPRFPADESQLNRALINLVENALRYTPAGGTVTVRAWGQQDYARIEVQDTGIGIAPDDLTHIFDYFYRAGPARAMDQNGTGLGLAIVQKIAEMHGGRVEVESVPGKGSLFRLWLPVS